MNVVFILLPLTLLLAIVGIFAFIWAVRRGQFDDVETPAVRMLFDDNKAAREPKSKGGSSS